MKIRLARKIARAAHGADTVADMRHSYHQVLRAAWRLAKSVNTAARNRRLTTEGAR